MSTLARYRRIAGVLDRRQPDLTVLMDGVHKTHNLAAIARTADAVGAGRIHAVTGDSRVRLGHRSAGGTAKWVDVTVHRSTEAAFTALRRDGLRLLAAHPDPAAQAYDAIDYTGPTALVLGGELDGLPPAARAAADAEIAIPVLGMVGSLNVSVAAALILYEAMRQRRAAGLYDRRRIPDNCFERLAFEWTHPAVAAWCRRHDLPYPAMDENGAIIEEVGSNRSTSAREFFARVEEGP